MQNHHWSCARSVVSLARTHQLSGLHKVTVTHFTFLTYICIKYRYTGYPVAVGQICGYLFLLRLWSTENSTKYHISQLDSTRSYLRLHVVYQENSRRSHYRTSSTTATKECRKANHLLTYNASLITSEKAVTQLHTRLLIFASYWITVSCDGFSELQTSGSGWTVHLISGVLQYLLYFKNCYPVHP